MFWQTARRRIELGRPLIMGILNVTPDSFSDGGSAVTVDDALRQAERLVEAGADIIDIGGESTRPGSRRVSFDEELSRLRVTAEIAKRFDTPISIDTSKSDVAEAMLNDGAEIINDISGLRWDPRLAGTAARARAGLVLMHSRGTFETMHSEPPVDGVIQEVIGGLSESLNEAGRAAVKRGSVVLDIGIGFGKTFEQNLLLLAELGKIVDEFAPIPILAGASRKSFLGRLTGETRPSARVRASVAAARAAIESGASIVRVHDVADTVQMIHETWGVKQNAI